MLKHYLTLFFNIFTRHSLYSILNVLGLGISLAIALIIGLFVHYELSYERQFEHAERIYQIGQKSTSNRFGSPDASSTPVSRRFPDMFPFIEDITRTTSFFQQEVLAADGMENMENNIGYADERFFHIFSANWLYGDPDQALSEPDTVVLTRSLARKYFGNEAEAFGNTLIYQRERPVKVVGVIDDLKQNTHLNFNAIFSINLFDELYMDLSTSSRFMDSWESSMFRTFARFDQKAPGDQWLAEMQPAIDAELDEMAEKITFNIRPITRLHLDHSMGRITVFAIIGITILLIAVINFVNLATARASTRAMEVGLKRGLGAGRALLIRQFLFESFVMAILAMTIALALGELLLPVANTVLEVQLSYAVFGDLRALAILVLATIGIGTLAGMYPAFYLTSLKPVQGMKNEGFTGKGSHYFRSGLVVLQFSVSIVLIIAALTFSQQIRYMNTVDRGFEHDNVVVIPFPEDEPLDLNTRWQTLQETLLTHPGIQEAKLSMLSPLPEGIWIIPVRQEGNPDRHQFSMFSGEPDFLQFYDIELLAGDYFPADYVSSPRSQEEESGYNFPSGLILNEAALRVLEWLPEEAVGRSLYLGQDDEKTVTVIGVVEDVVVDPERAAEPYVYTIADNIPTSSFLPFRMNIRYADNDVEAAMEHVRQVWEDNFPDQIMQPKFLSEFLQAQSQGEKNQLRFFIYASVFAILVTCFGLFGLATFSAERRTKEIGVRKVMGGSVWSIVLMLTNDFSKLVLISNVIAWPMAYYAMNRWLENFAYRIDLTPLIFIGSSLIALCIAWVTVGGTAAKAASAKPVLALRYE